MIKVIRPEAPPFFNSDTYREYVKELRNLKKEGSQQRMQFRPEVARAAKPALLGMFRLKCAYCESQIGTISSGEVDNFRPKGGAKGFDKAFAPEHYWWLAYEWTNLYFSCAICNSKYKGNWFPLENERLRAPIETKGTALQLEKPLLIDPCLDNPDEHLSFGTDGTIEPRTPRGKATIEILGLNRRELVHARARAVLALLYRLDGYFKRSARVKQGLHAYIDKLLSTSPPQPYAATERAAFSRWFAGNEAVWHGTTSDAMVPEVAPGKKSPKDKAGIAKKPPASIKKVEDKLTDSLRRFSIKSIEIENFRSIKHLKLTIPQSSNDEEQRESWLLILGDNGVGKSSILQAVALALVGTKELKRLKPVPKDILRRGTKSGSVVIESYEHDEPVRLDFNAREIKGSLAEPPTFILAYGSVRLLPKGGVKAPRRYTDHTAVSNLFDYSAALTDVNKWLSAVKSSFNERIGPALFDLLDLKSDEKVKFERGRLIIEDADGKNDLNKVSDGYKSIIATACDIMKTLWVEGAGYHTVQGIVLINELGNHLHPKWRLRIAGALRRAFPKLQFIVSTHEPLCLRGLSHGEVAVLLEKPGEGIKLLDSESLPDHNLLSIDQLLTSDLFGLLNTLDPVTEQSYNDYYALLGKKPGARSKEDKLKIKEYQVKLTQKEMLGGTPRKQMLLQAMDEIWAKNIQDKGFKTVSELKQDTVTELKELVASKPLDWL